MLILTLLRIRTTFLLNVDQFSKLIRPELVFSRIQKGITYLASEAPFANLLCSTGAGKISTLIFTAFATIDAI